MPCYFLAWLSVGKGHIPAEALAFQETLFPEGCGRGTAMVFRSNRFCNVSLRMLCMHAMQTTNNKDRTREKKTYARPKCYFQTQKIGVGFFGG